MAPLVISKSEKVEMRVSTNFKGWILNESDFFRNILSCTNQYFYRHNILNVMSDNSHQVLKQ